MVGNLVVNVEIIVERDGHFLLIVRSAEEEYGAGWITLPGGKLETDAPDQRALELTAQRELKEEVDLDVSLGDIHYVESHLFFVDNTPVLDVVMMTRNAFGEARPVDPREVEDVIWMTPNEILSHPEIPVWTRDSVSLAITYVTQENP